MRHFNSVSLGGAVLFLFAGLAWFSAIMTLGNSLLPEDRQQLPARAEQFDPRLAGIDTLDKAEGFVRAGLKPNPSQAEIANGIEHFVRYRFVHDVGHIRRSNDWVAWLAGVTVWNNLSFTTRPDDMLKSRRGICSQQSMLMQALLARFGIEYSTVGFRFPAHMFVGAKIDGRWAVYDPDGEPNRRRTVFYSEMSDPRVLLELYRSKPGNPAFGPGNLGQQMAIGSLLGAFEMKWVNENPAPHATIFNNVSSLMSRFGGAMFSLIAVLIWGARAHRPARDKSASKQWTSRRSIVRVSL